MKKKIKSIISLLSIVFVLSFTGLVFAESEPNAGFDTANKPTLGSNMPGHAD